MTPALSVLYTSYEFMRNQLLTSNQENRTCTNFSDQAKQY